MEAKHTKVNWIMTRKPWVAVYNLELDEMGVDSISNEEAEANRKLMEAAPRMLQELTEIVDYINKMGVISMAMKVIKNRAKLAIQKATE